MLDIFEILGPVMIGPSSSHTAGAAKIGAMARTLLGAPPVKGRHPPLRLLCRDGRRPRYGPCAGRRSAGHEAGRSSPMPDAFAEAEKAGY